MKRCSICHYETRNKKGSYETELEANLLKTTEKRYLVLGAGFSLLVIRVSRTFVQLRPQSFGLPVVQPFLQLGVEVPEILGIDVQLPAELGEVMLHILAGLGLDEEVKGRV